MPAHATARRSKRRPRSLPRQVFVFTAEEKKTGACILGALLLGLATMHYRATHPQPVKLTAKQEFAAKRATRASNAQARSARSQTTLAAARVTPIPGESQDDD